MNSIGQKVKNLRRENGLTQDELASALSISRNYVCLIETDKKIPSFKTISKMSEVFGVHPSEITANDKTVENLSKEKTIEYVRSQIERLEKMLRDLEENP